MIGFVSANKQPYLAVPLAQQTNQLGLESSLAQGSRIGTTITAHASANTMGSYTTILTLTNACTGLWVRVTGVAVTTAIRDALMDISGDGGSTVLIPSIDIGEAGPAAAGTTSPNMGKLFFFPGIQLAASSVIQAIMQCTTGAQTAVVAIWADTSTTWSNQSTSAWVAYGADTANSRGTSVTPGSGNYGNWYQLGTTTSRAHKLWTIGLDLFATASVNTVDSIVDIGFGPNSGAVTAMATSILIPQAASESVCGTMPLFFSYPVDAGSKVWARMASGDAVAKGIILYGN